MIIKVAELKGIKSLRVLNVFQTLMFGLKMLPQFASEEFEDFYLKIQSMSPEQQEQMIRTAVQFVPLDAEDLGALFGFCLDPNGVPLSAQNINNLKPDELLDIIVLVCKEVVKFKIYLVSDAEKKKSRISPLT